MYVNYIYSANSAANILTDVVGLLTGSITATSGLTAAAQTNSRIWNTQAAGWSVHDASAGTNAQCLKVAYHDDGTKYIYVVIDTNTAGYILMKLYETWNATSHTGTNKSYNSDATTYAQRVNTGAGGQLYIRATSKVIAMFSYNGSAYGATTGNGPTIITQRTRRTVWDTTANGYPPVFWGCWGGTAWSTPRFLGNTLTDLTDSSAVTTSVVGPYGATLTSPTALMPNENKAPLSHQMLGVCGVNATHGFLGGDISSLCDIYYTTYNYGSVFDELTYTDNIYVVWTGGNYRIAVRRA